MVTHYVSCDACATFASTDVSVDRAQDMLANVHAHTGCDGKRRRAHLDESLNLDARIVSRRKRRTA